MLFKRNIPIVITCITLLIAGCNMLNQEGSHWPQWDEHNPPPPDLLEMKLVDVPDTVSQGESVEFTMKVTNTSEQDYMVSVGGNPTSEDTTGHRDFLVTGEEETLYWRFHYPDKTEVINGREVRVVRVAALVGVFIKAGESYELSMEWDGTDYLHENPLKPGNYTVTGWYPVNTIETITEEEREVILDTYEESGISYLTTEPVEFVVTGNEQVFF